MAVAADPLDSEGAGTSGAVAAASAADQPARDVPVDAGHFVQFYRDEEVLLASIADYVRTAVREGAAAVVIATRPHIEALQRRLQLEGDRSGCGKDQLVLLDAEQTLAKFMVNGQPDRARFIATVGRTLSDALRRYGRVAAFGEMVALLWREGHVDATLKLEQLWNELARGQSFTLFCAFPMEEWAADREGNVFESICAQHGSVMSSDSPELSKPEQGKLVARLHQKALALDRQVRDEAVKQEELARHLAAIVESSDDAIVSKTLDGVVRSWNPGAERIFGWSAEEIIGKSITLIMPPERLAEEGHILETLRAGDRIEHFETVRIAKDGRRVDISLTVSPVCNAGGEIVGASKVARDITSRKSAEATVRRNQRLLDAQKEAFQAAVNRAPLETSLGILMREAIEQIGDGVRCGFYIADADGGTLRHLCGMPESYAESVNGFVVGPDTIACGLAAYIRQPVISADVWQDPRWREWRWLAEKFEYRACWSFPVETVAEKVVGTFAMYLRDPREPLPRERDLAEALTRAAAMIISQHQETEERGRAVAALRENEAKLIANDRQKNEFLAMLGHELRNPLAPIRNASEVLARLMNGDRRIVAATDMLRRQTAQLTRLVDDLLDVGRITQRHIQLQRVPLDVAGVIAQALETVDPLVREKHHHIAITHSYEPLYVSGDFARLVQCVVNLLTNAAKYTDREGHIRVESRADRSHAVITVADNGPGIAAVLLPLVFDLFVQSDRTLGRSQGGLGIGLSIVKRLVEMHGGEVSAHSPGLAQGSTFEIRLPRIAQPQSTAAAKIAPKVEPRRVLIVDDNTDAADSLSMLLTLQGHSTQVAYAAKDALPLVEEFQPDVALLDIGLPEMDGYQLAERLRSIPHLSDLRLIAVTGYGQPSDRQRSLAAGFDGHVVKPIDPAALERILTERLDRSHPQ